VTGFFVLTRFLEILRRVFGARALFIDVQQISGIDEWLCGLTFTVLR